MRTKKGDWIKICHHGRTAFDVRPHFSLNKYKVIAITPDGYAMVNGPFRMRGICRSWVRCADMKEGGK
jgi:hypothetical protein